VLYHNGHNDLNKLAETVEAVSTRLAREYKLGRFDTMIVIGNSGVIVGVPVHLNTGIPLVIVRKDWKDSHSYSSVINPDDLGDRLLFLDDLIDRGNTAKRVMQTLHDSGYHDSEITAIYQYQHYHKERDILAPSPALSYRANGESLADFIFNAKAKGWERP